MFLNCSSGRRKTPNIVKQRNWRAGGSRRRSLIAGVGGANSVGRWARGARPGGPLSSCGWGGGGFALSSGCVCHLPARAATGDAQRVQHELQSGNSSGGCETGHTAGFALLSAFTSCVTSYLIYMKNKRLCDAYTTLCAAD